MQGWKGNKMAVKAGERNVPDTPQNRQLNAVWYARELALYTIQICKNKNAFSSGIPMCTHGRYYPDC